MGRSEKHHKDKPRYYIIFDLKGMLDNLVAGGIAEGSHPQETVIKESGEEAGIFDKALLTGIKSCGAVSLYHDDEIRGLQAETEFVYDLELPASFQPTPEDGEVEGYCATLKL
jgi:8-oxo-dGTP pyrophosphatase MutT (NUDIX family)